MYYNRILLQDYWHISCNLRNNFCVTSGIINNLTGFYILHNNFIFYNNYDLYTLKIAYTYLKQHCTLYHDFIL